MVNEFKLTVVHCMRVDLTLDKKTGKSGLGHRAAGPPGRGAFAGRGPRADGPSGPRAAGPSRAVGRGPLSRGPAFSKTLERGVYGGCLLCPLYPLLRKFNS